jgi:hypothetical protein
MLGSRAGRAASVLGIALLFAVLFTFPVAFKLDRAGRLDTGDGHWSIWCVTWVAHALATDPSTLFDANIFHPHQRTLAYSENNIVAGVIGLPVYLATRNAYATHNTAVLASFVLSFLSAFALVRYLTKDTGLAVLAALAYAYCPFIFARMAHIQLLMTFGLPLSLLALHRFVDRPAAGRALAMSAALALQALACGYYGIFGGLLVGLGVLLFAATRGLWRSRRYWSLVALAAAGAILPVVPFFLPYVRVQEELGFSRTIEDAVMYSADWRAWLASGAWAHRWWHPMLGTWSEVLFPGLLTSVAGIAGGAIALRRAVPGAAAAVRPGDRRDVVALYVLVALLAFWISFGPAAGLYTLFFHTVPVFSLLRAPARFGIVVSLGLVVLMSLGLARWLDGRHPRQRLAIVAALLVALAAELATVPLYMREAEPPNIAYRLLARLRPGPVVELPFFYERSDFPRHAWYMTNSTLHWRPLVNGYSDHIPQDFRDMVIPMSSFPTRASFKLLKLRGVRYVIFHLGWYDRRSREKLIDRIGQYGQYLSPLSRENDVWLFEIVGWPPEP